MTQKLIGLRPADFRPPPHGGKPNMSATEREYFEWIERGFMQLATAINRNTAVLDEFGRTLTHVANQSIYRIQAETWNDVTGVDSLDDAKEMARGLRVKLESERKRERKLRKLGALAAPIVAGLGAALWKLIESQLIK